MMICNQLSSILGFACEPLSDDGTVAMIDTSFKFEDGDSLPVFVELVGETRVRFFDDGELIFHLSGRGMKFDNKNRLRPIKAALERSGVDLTESGEVEVWGDLDSAPQVFARYLSALLRVVDWEHDQAGISTDVSVLVDEVAGYLRAWKPQAELRREPTRVGTSGQTYKLDFELDGELIVAITSHPNSTSSALRKVVDIVSAPGNNGVKFRIIIDDRPDHVAAEHEASILAAVATVWPLTSLIERSGAGTTVH